jgi:hypothetical protein
MYHEMRAEYAPDVSPGSSPVKIWHMVRGRNTLTAMCGRVLDGAADTRSEEAWAVSSEPFCHSCGAMYLREVP